LLPQETYLSFFDLRSDDTVMVFASTEFAKRCKYSSAPREGELTNPIVSYPISRIIQQFRQNNFEQEPHIVDKPTQALVRPRQPFQTSHWYF